MPDLDKLIDLLEKIKETDPAFTEKAGKAIEALIGEDDDDDEEVILEVEDADVEEVVSEPTPPPEPVSTPAPKAPALAPAPAPESPPEPPPAPEPEPEPEPETASEPEPEPEPEPEAEIEKKPIFPEVVELKFAHLKEIIEERSEINQKITDLGLLLQNYESDKDELLEYIERKHKLLTEYIAGLRSTYNLDPHAEYSLEFPRQQGEKARFVKRQ